MRGATFGFMPNLRISDAALIVGVSDDTLRRWLKTAAVVPTTDAAGRMVVPGEVVAAFARHTAAPPDATGVRRSARNRFPGIVTEVKRDGVMAQVDLQCGPFRVVSLMSAEAVDELELTVGTIATAVVKATTVVVDTTPGAGS